MKKITLFVGDCDESIAQTAKQFDSEAVLIDQSNYLEYLVLTDGFTGYTSLADLPKDLSIFYSLMEKSDSIIYCPPVHWSDNKSLDLFDPSSSIQGLTEGLLFHINKLKDNVIGDELIKVDCSLYLNLVDSRKRDNENLWVAGCAVTAGVGVDFNESYGYLLGARIDRPVSILAAPGSSISWSADQILRSDIKPNDIVVWGLTTEERLTFWSDEQKKFKHTNSPFNEIDGVSTDAINQLILHKTNFTTAIQKVHSVVNFCNKINAKLLIFNINPSASLSLHLQNIKEFFPYVYPSSTYIDVGSDQAHPGINQHQAYADFCHSALKKLQYI